MNAKQKKRNVVVPNQMEEHGMKRIKQIISAVVLASLTLSAMPLQAGLLRDLRDAVNTLAHPEAVVQGVEGAAERAQEGIGQRMEKFANEKLGNFAQPFMIFGGLLGGLALCALLNKGLGIGPKTSGAVGMGIGALPALLFAARWLLSDKKEEQDERTQLHKRAQEAAQEAHTAVDEISGMCKDAGKLVTRAERAIQQSGRLARAATHFKAGNIWEAGKAFFDGEEEAAPQQPTQAPQQSAPAAPAQPAS